jgi:regulator of sirC expression with transglutaminase-like and TPR domain
VTEEAATARFGELVARPDDEIPLDEAAALIGAHASPGLDVAHQLARLDELAGTCPVATLDGLCRHLFDDLGFAGNREDYLDPRNSLLHEVLDRRRGIPISLSVVTLEVGRRLDVPLAGVGMPSHFLVRHLGQPATFLDPFDGGVRLNEADCEALFRALGGTGPWVPAYLDPVGPRVILTRMLTNLQGIFMPRDLRSASWVLRLRLLIPGLELPERVALARALGSLGQFEAAGAALEGAADAAPPEDADRLRAQARALRARSN